MNSEGFEQFTMFNVKRITDNVLCWENALSYSEELPGFIESLDIEPNSYSRISKWDKGAKVINMSSLKESTGVEILNRKTLYVANSFAMAFEMCFERYCHHLGLNQEDYNLELNQISIIKNSQTGPVALDYDQNTEAELYIIAYLNDDYSGGEVSFYNSGLSLKPKAASVLVIPKSELAHYRVSSVEGTRYVGSIAVHRRTK